MQTPLRVLCTGYRSGGGYAELCGIWAAVTYPGANVRTITFGAPEVRRTRNGGIMTSPQYASCAFSPALAQDVSDATLVAAERPLLEHCTQAAGPSASLGLLLFAKTAISRTALP